MTDKRLVLLGLLTILAISASGQVPSETPAWLPDEYRYDVPFFPDAKYDSAVETPQKILGFGPGERPVTHAHVEKCLQAWARHPRIELVPFGQTHERRTLYYAVITSEANQKKLDDIRAAIGKLADPRKLGGDADADSIIKDTPAIAWMAYCIHGDEMSGTDAAVALVYHLLAATDDATKALLDNLVIIIDPLMNPDGRDRFIKQVDECNGYTPNLDPFATQHAGRWPRGRTNHYFFDMNRDWIYATQPETQARQRAIVSWNPQLLVDGHEMGHDNTFLFNPAREPFNPNLAPSIRKWWNTFADDAGAAFDRYGWSYYSREWADFWYPGYSDGWSTCLGTIGILYEQARTGGRAIRQPTGRILTYREAVHHQAICSLSNLRSLQKNREAVLRDFLAIKRAAVAGGVPAGRGAGEAEPPALPQTFILPPSRNASRQRAFLDYLANQGVEVHVASQAFTATDVLGTLKQKIDSREFPAGTILIQRRQPLGTLVGALLDFDPRIDKAFLDSERRELETKRNSRLYDITGWSPPLAWGLEAYWSPTAVDVASTLRESSAARPTTTAPATQTALNASQPARNAGSMPADEKAYAYVIDSADDAIVRATAFLLQAGVQCRVAEKEFRAAGRIFPRGSLLIRRHENAADFLKRLGQAAEDSGAAVHAASTARSPDDTPDLGGEYFPLLLPPRIALAGDGGGDANSFGALWHLLDREAGLSVSLVDNEMSGVDLRRFNVVITTSGATVRSRGEELATWLRSGGTLIAIEGAASALADEKLKLSAVRRREDVLKQLEEYASVAAVERAAGRVNVDVEKLWGDVVESVPPGEKLDKPETKLTDEALEDWRQIFSPTGAIVRGELRTDHWLTWGVAVSSATRKAPLAPASAPASAPTSTSAPSTASAPAASQPIADAWDAIPLTFRAHELDGPLVEMPLFAQGSTVLLAKAPVQTPVRFAPAKSLRLSGLLWAEAAVRQGGSAAVTVERVGRGQLILFAQDPNFRAAWRGSRRLLLNAILLGPGCGTSPPAP